jgi:hypothetical protein
MAAQERSYLGVHHQAATLIQSDLWRSVHLAAPPLAGDHTPQQLAALAPTAPGNTATRLEYYEAFVRTLEQLCGRVTRRLEAENPHCSHEDRVWLSTRLAALSRRFRASILRQAPDDARRDTAVRVAVERITARLRCDVERYPSATNFQDTVDEFVIATLEHFVALADNGTWDHQLVVSCAHRSRFPCQRKLTVPLPPVERSSRTPLHRRTLKVVVAHTSLTCVSLASPRRLT